MGDAPLIGFEAAHRDPATGHGGAPCGSGVVSGPGHRSGPDRPHHHPDELDRPEGDLLGRLLNRWRGFRSQGASYS